MQQHLACGDLAALSPFQAATKPWMVLHTRSRQEKAVARFFAAATIRHYLPLMDRVTIVRGRKTTTKIPLLPGYVFISGDLDDAYRATSTRRVCQIILVPDQHQLVAELDGHDVAALRSVLLDLPLDTDKPTAIICHTVKGKGVEFIENDMAWHHKNRVSDDELQSLYAALEAN